MLKRLRAPWRSRYVRGETESSEGCIFCRIAESTEDRKNLVLFKSEICLVVLNRFPYINGHIMLMPKRHIESFSDLLPEEFLQINRLLVESEKALRVGLGAIGINGGWNQGGCAGAGVDGHLHVHMLPRWPGDTNFLTTVAETRVISQSLEESYENLKPFFMEII